MKVLAIDPGSSCGFAVGEILRAVPDVEGAPKTVSRVLVSGVWHLAPARGESPGMRYVRLRAALQQIRTAFPDIEVVVFEQAHQRGGAATEYAYGVTTHLQSWAAEHGIDHASVHSGTLKKWATGRGKADKDEMRRMGRSRFKPQTTTDDEIDALWICAYALEVLIGS